MNVEQLLELAEGLGWFAERMRELPEERGQALQLCLTSQMTQLAILELAQHLTDGVDPYEALLKTARGDLKVPDSKQTLFKIALANLGSEKPDA